MLGAIVGDIVGSVYEQNNIKTKDFPLFRKDCFFTDDTIMTCAVAEAIMNGGQKDDFIDAMKKYGSQMKFALTIVLTKHVRKLSLKPLSPFLKVETSKMR